MSYKCPICGTNEEKYIGIRNGTIYCRRCLSFQSKGGDINENPKQQYPILNMRYSLTKEQQELSDKLISLVENKKDVLIHAVCGAGKTEIVTAIIFNFLKEQKRIAFFIPRRDLVLEIGERLQEIFPETKFSLVYGGHSNDLCGSIVVATTHQAYRYEKAFDLVIIDEIDAFPYKGDDLLNHFVFRSAKGSIVSLSATPSTKDKENKELLCLYKRYHGKQMPIPKKIIAEKIYLKYVLIKLLKKYQKENKICFIYVPTINDGKKLQKSLLKKFNSLTFVYSSMMNRNQTLKQIHQGHFTVVITTTILERGVTFENLQVIIYKANHTIFNLSTILQICGRVGRKAKYTEGDIYFLATKNKKEFSECISEVNKYNESL